MRKVIRIALLTAGMLAALTACGKPARDSGDHSALQKQYTTPAQQNPKSNPVEDINHPRPSPIIPVVHLTGKLHRPLKWGPQLEVIPAGQIEFIDLHGKQIEGMEEGTPLRVRGVIRSQLHVGSQDSPFLSQWVIWLEISDIEVLPGLDSGEWLQPPNWDPQRSTVKSDM